MDEARFKERTKQLGLRVIRLVNALPKTKAADVIGRQILRSAISVGASYRAACRAKSAADIISKLAIVEEEAEETEYWLELLADGGIMKPEMLEPLKKEAGEIIAMTVASIKTIRSRARSEANRPKK